MKIRKAAEQDFPMILELNREIQALHAASEPKLFKPAAQLTLSVEKFRASVANPNLRIYVADADGVAIGYVFAEASEQRESPYRFPAKLLYIHHLGVDKAHRDQGIGKMLLEHAVTQAKQDGFERVELDVWSFNVGAKSFYAGAGFRTFNERMAISISGVRHS